MNRDLKLAAVAAIVTVVPGLVLWVVGAPTALAVVVSLGAAVFAMTALARRWYRQVIDRIDAQALHLRSVVGLVPATADLHVHWTEHAITPESLALLRHLVDSLELETVLELGSGTSTLVLASDFRRRGRGHVTSIDDDARWAGQTARKVEAHGLGGFAEVRVAPLVAVDTAGKAGDWYDVSFLDEGRRFDLIFVDGPPAWRGDAQARLPALYRLRRHLSDRGLLVLDDAARSGERAIAEQWRKAFPELHFRYVPVGRGLLVASVSREPLDLLPA
ncbi:MAG: class I SAM-dependent methyltransferase [Proteobacteria bacterium]|nr:class I SAM-dependent methyltransferase [Pseudomonadota bacterium]